MEQAFYTAEGEHFRATELCRGPWHPDYQHGGPPSALIAHAVEQAADGMQVARLSIDLLKPVPIDLLSIQCRERTGGKRRRVLELELRQVNGGELVARAQAMLMRQAPTDLPELDCLDPEPPRPPEQCPAQDFGFFTDQIGFHSAVELRRAAGGIGTGHSRMWMRQRVSLIAGEPPSPLQRLMTVADCGNGVSLALDIRRWAFMNPDLTVNQRRAAVGEWLCLDAATHFQSHGLGMAESRIWDELGVVANGCQNLLLEPQPRR